MAIIILGFNLYISGTFLRKSDYWCLVTTKNERFRGVMVNLYMKFDVFQEREASYVTDGDDHTDGRTDERAA